MTLDDAAKLTDHQLISIVYHECDTKTGQLIPWYVEQPDHEDKRGAQERINEAYYESLGLNEAEKVVMRRDFLEEQEFRFGRNGLEKRYAKALEDDVEAFGRGLEQQGHKGKDLKRRLLRYRLDVAEPKHQADYQRQWAEFRAEQVRKRKK